MHRAQGRRSRSETGAETVPRPIRTAVNCRQWTRPVLGILYFRKSAGSVNDPGGQGVVGSNPVVSTKSEGVSVILAPP
jgi:hypothetical protein